MKHLIVLVLLCSACGESTGKNNANNANNANNLNNANNDNNTNNATNNQNNQASAEFIEVAAILASNCGIDGCHGTPANKSYRIENGVDGSDEDVYAAITDVVAATGRQMVEPGDSSESEIYLRITEGLGLPLMPQTGALDQADIDTIGTWIDNGANF